MFTYHYRFLKKSFVLLVILVFSTASSAGSFEDFFVAARNDNESAMVGLALRGFDLNTRNEDGDGALILALREGSDKVAGFLLSQDAVNVELRNPKGESPLMMAALKGRLALAQRLIERKAEVNKPGWTPLHYAAANAEPESLAMVRLMLDRFAYIDAESPNKTTPLMMAARYGHIAVVKLLLEEGADPTLLNEQGLAALDFARGAERPDVAEVIGAAVRARTPSRIR
jgi:ankyrin repeat protein